MRDTVLSNTQRNKELKIEEVKQEFDLILSYDSIHDVPQYKLTYAPVYISKFDEIVPSSTPRKYDIAFIAEAKDRLKIIHDLYRRFIENGIKCYFYICHAKKTERLDVYDIIYTDKKLGRFEMLRKELEANCILEILNSDAYSNTLRFWEAVMYNRKFYTNWKGVVNSPYYDPRYIRVFENLDDIDYTFIKERVEVDYNYQGYYLRFIYWIFSNNCM